MRSNISPEYYFDKDVFDKEQVNIFKKNWVFVGFKSQLQNTNDFITRHIGGVPVVVQNLKGTVKAFLNVCSHRFSILQQEEAGNRPLMCPYHGWSYNENGIPTGIPKKPLFQEFTYEEQCDMKLKEFHVDYCGELCFVSLEAEPITLKEFLADFFDEIALISENTGKLVDVNQMTIAANWKVIVENTLEGYHVALIHANTIYKLKPSGLRFIFTEYHSIHDIDLNLQRTDPKNAKIDAMFTPRSYMIDGYKHFVIFPNLLISTTHGTSYNFSVIEPISNSTTKFTSYVYLAKVNENAKRAFLDAYAQTLIDFNREVFKEDKDICQQVQIGVAHTPYQGVLSLEEERVHAFQNNYIKLMGNDR